MDEKEWFEKHPSYLKYKKIMMLTTTEMDALDDTQVDKKIVAEVITKNVSDDMDRINIFGALGLE